MSPVVPDLLQKCGRERQRRKGVQESRTPIKAKGISERELSWEFQSTKAWTLSILCGSKNIEPGFSLFLENALCHLMSAAAICDTLGNVSYLSALAFKDPAGCCTTREMPWRFSQKGVKPVGTGPTTHCSQFVAVPHGGGVVCENLHPFPLECRTECFQCKSNSAQLQKVDVQTTRAKSPRISISPT